MYYSRSGFSTVVVIVVVAFLAAVGFFGWQMTWVRDGNVPVNQEQFEIRDDRVMNPTTGSSQELLWQQAANGWQAIGKVPACPNPLLHAPVDLTQATAILYPGQTRGGNYKPHGGFRFDGTANNQVTVTAPIDGYIVRGGRYLSEGEVQYTFDVMNNCGVMYRVGHFRTLPANLQKIANTWPQAVEGDSRTQQVNPPIFIRQGEVLATSVGIIAARNTFFDLGVYDYRQTNTASKSAAYQQTHMQDKELSWHAVCWFDFLSPTDEAKVRSLPAGDPTSGKTSDYCS